VRGVRNGTMLSLERGGRLHTKSGRPKGFRNALQSTILSCTRWSDAGDRVLCRSALSIVLELFFCTPSPPRTRAQEAYWGQGSCKGTARRLDYALGSSQKVIFRPQVDQWLGRRRLCQANELDRREGQRTSAFGLGCGYVVFSWRR
jgi:hypothetical protein